MRATKVRALGPDAEKGTPKIVMKRFLTILSLVAFVACSSETLDSADKQKEESVICFGNLDTRDPISQATDITQFGVFAEQTVGEDEESAYVQLLENERVYKVNDAWTYDNKRYWIDNRTFHFFAVYPYFDPNTPKVQPANLKQSGIDYSGYQINFETPSAADQDLLVDMVTVRTAKNENDEELVIDYPTVNFDFTHILSKINLKVAKHAANSGNKIKITSLTINGMRSSGSYSVSRSSSYIANWSNLTGAMRYSATFEDTEIKVGVGTELLGEGLLLIPQSIAVEQIAITISYDYYNVNGSVEDSFTATTYIPAGSWVADTKYVYTMTLNAVDNNIYFSAPQISPWGEREVGGSIVIM